MGSVLTTVQQKLARYTPKQMVAAGLLLAVLLGAGVGLVRWLTAPTYEVLYSGLQTGDAAAVVEAVTATGTAYEVVEQGATTTVLVPAERVTDLRMSLAAENLPGDSVVGYELLDTQGVTVSTFREQVNYQRALEGELARTLMSLEDVQEASVHIVLPRERLYSSEDAPATASVTLTTRGTMDRDEVDAVSHLVASSVPDLDPGAVTVTDAAGQLLSAPGGDTGSANTAEQEAEAAFASRLETRAASMLASVVGDGKAVVRVQTDLDFTERTRQAEIFDPERVATDTESTERERYNSSTPNNGGILTTDPDEDAQNEQDNATSNYERDAADRDYSVSREVTSETDAPGEVRRMTVSVMLDPEAAGDADVQQVQALVENAVGFDADRGDQIAVEFLAFTDGDEPAEDPSAAIAAAEQRTKMVVGLAVAGAILAGVIVLAIFLFRGRRKKDDAAALAGDADPAAVTSALPASPTTLDPNAPLGVPATSAGEADRLRQRVAEQPKIAADVISGMLASDQVGRR